MVQGTLNKNDTKTLNHRVWLEMLGWFIEIIKKDSIIKIGNIGREINFMVAPHYDAIFYIISSFLSTQKFYSGKINFYGYKLMGIYRYFADCSAYFIFFRVFYLRSICFMFLYIYIFFYVLSTSRK